MFLGKLTAESTATLIVTAHAALLLGSPSCPIRDSNIRALNYSFGEGCTFQSAVQVRGRVYHPSTLDADRRCFSCIAF